MKKVILFLIIIVSCFFIFGCEKREEKKEEPKGNQMVQNEKSNSEEDVVIFSDDATNIEAGSKMDQLFTSLLDFGTSIYKEKKYLYFKKVNSMYFASLKELNAKYNFDITNFTGDDGTSCDVEKSGIYFDIDNVSKLEYTDNFLPVLPILIGCSKEELQK